MALTDKQKEVLDECERLLSEHFDAHVVIAYIDSVNDDNDNFTAGGFNGGRQLAIGLMESEKHRLLREQAKEEEVE